MVTPIGGYFELELNNFETVFHNGAIALNSGRNSLEYILLSKRINRVHVPYFTCDVLLEPLERHRINYFFYQINEQFLPVNLHMREGDALIYTNYFGINQKGVDMVSKMYKNVIIDNSQAFFDLPTTGVDTFYSPRKFFGLPDGGFVYTNGSSYLKVLEKDEASDRMEHLLLRIESGPESGYLAFLENDKKLSNQPIKAMSLITQRLLKNIDFNRVMKHRQDNFQFLHNYLNPINKLSSLIDLNKHVAPLVYPLWMENGQKIREMLLQKKMYTATYWPNVFNWAEVNSLEYEFAKNIISLPIDQRIRYNDLKLIIKNIIG
jgi:hypothetical protein